MSDDQVEDPIFQGRGAPLATYDRKSADWPTLWRMPPAVYEDDENPDRLIAFADDHLLRQAINVWDNLLRAPGMEINVGAGLMSAFVRFLVGVGPQRSEAEVRAMAAQLVADLPDQFAMWFRTNRDGWDPRIPQQGDDQT